MSNEDTQCSKLYNTKVEFDKTKKLAYLFGSKIFVKKLCEYIDDLGLISMEGRGQGIKNNLVGGIIWNTLGIHSILLDLGRPDKTDTDKWKDLIKTMSVLQYVLESHDFNNIIETIYNFQGWLQNCPKIILDTIILYLTLGKVPDYTIWALWSVVEYTDKKKEKLFGKKTDTQIQSNIENITTRLNKSIISLQGQQIRKLYLNKHSGLHTFEEGKFQDFLNYCKKQYGENTDSFSEIIKVFEKLYNEYESKYDYATKSPTKSPTKYRKSSFLKYSFMSGMFGGKKTRRHHKRKNLTKKK